MEVFAAGKSRTYMYPKSWAYDNLESREFEALIGTFSREYLGREVKLAERKFLAAEEIQGLNAWLREIEYPLPTCDLLEKLPIRLLERGLRSEGLQGQNGQWWAEWPLTNRTNPKGYYVPLGYVRKTAISDVRAEGIRYVPRSSSRTLFTARRRFFGQRIPP